VNQDAPNLEVVRKLIKIFPAGAGMPSLSGNLPLHYCVSRARCACYSVVYCSCVLMALNITAPGGLFATSFRVVWLSRSCALSVCTIVNACISFTADPASL
jgi:hypothetical protein